MSLNEVLKPAEEIARKGFTVDATFHQDTLDNAQALLALPRDRRDLPARRSARPGRRGAAQPRPGQGLPRAADPRHRLAAHRALGRAVVAEVQDPTTAPGVTVPKGQMTAPTSRHTGSTARHPRTASTAASTSTAWTPRAAAASPSPRSSTCSSPSRSAPARGRRPHRGGVPALVQRGVRDGLRRPQPLRRRRAGRPDRRADLAGVRRRALLPLRRRQGPEAAGGVRLTRTAATTAPCAPRRHDRPAGDGAVDDLAHRHRPVGRRRHLHADHRAVRRLGHRRPRLGLPAQQRAHRLQLRAGSPPASPTRTCPAPASGRAARWPRRSCSRTAARTSRPAAPVARRSSPPSRRSSPASSTAGSTSVTPSPRRASRRATAPRRRRPPIFATAIGDELRAKGHVLRSRPVIGNGTAIRSLSPAPLDGGRRADPSRRRLGDGRRPAVAAAASAAPSRGLSASTRRTRKPLADAWRAHGIRSSASIQRWRLSEPRLRWTTR